MLSDELIKKINDRKYNELVEFYSERELKPSDLIKFNYIMDLEEGLKGKALYDFLEFCNTYLEVKEEYR